MAQRHKDIGEAKRLRIVDNCNYCSYNLGMITVGVRDLKNQFSQYLQYVKEGEKVIITEHSRIVAVISLPENKKNLSGIEDTLSALSKEGRLIMAKRQKSCVDLPITNEKLDWVSAYNEVRAEH